MGGPSAPFESLTGKSQSQNQSGTTASRTQFDPAQLAQLNQQRDNLIAQTQGAQRLGGTLQGQVAAAGAPQLQTGFNQLQGVQAFQPGQAGMDAVGRAQIAQGTQALNQQAGTQQRALAQQFGGQGGVGRVLGRQAAMQSRLQSNPLLAQAAEGSVARGQQGFQNVLGLAGQQAGLQQQGNQSQLAQADAQAANRREQFGFGTAGLQAQQQLLPFLSQLAQQQGTTIQETRQKGDSRSGGLLGNFGLK